MAFGLSDLQDFDIVVIRSGQCYLVRNKLFCGLSGFLQRNSYREDLLYGDGESISEWDIVQVARPNEHLSIRCLTESTLREACIVFDRNDLPEIPNFAVVVTEDGVKHLKVGDAWVGGLQKTNPCLESDVREVYAFNNPHQALVDISKYSYLPKERLIYEKKS